MYVFFSFIAFLATTGHSCSILFENGTYISQVNLLNDTTTYVALDIRNTFNSVAKCAIFSLITNSTVEESNTPCNTLDTYPYSLPSEQPISGLKTNERSTGYSFSYIYEGVTYEFNYVTNKNITSATYWSSNELPSYSNTENNVLYILFTDEFFGFQFELLSVLFDNGFDNPPTDFYLAPNVIQLNTFLLTFQFTSIAPIYTGSDIVRFSLPCCLCYGSNIYRFIYSDTTSYEWAIDDLFKVDIGDTQIDDRNNIGFELPLGFSTFFRTYDLNTIQGDETNIQTKIYVYQPLDCEEIYQQCLDECRWFFHFRCRRACRRSYNECIE